MATNIFTHSTPDYPTAHGSFIATTFYDAEASKILGAVRIKRNDGTDPDQAAVTFLGACLITQITHNREVACIIEPTISGDLYLSHFGDKPTEYTVQGIAFDSPDCAGKTGGKSSINSIYDFYDTYRLQATPQIQDAITVTTYNTMKKGKDAVINYAGLLTKMFATVELADTSGIRQCNFTFSFVSLE